MPHQIAEIKGLDSDTRSKLEAARIRTVEDLLRATETPQQRAALARQMGVAESQLTGWVSRADLMRIRGVGAEIADLLALCGVGSCKELQHRTAQHLHGKLKETNDAKKIMNHAPTLTQVDEWISAARIISAKPL